MLRQQLARQLLTWQLRYGVHGQLLWLLTKHGQGLRQLRRNPSSRRPVQLLLHAGRDRNLSDRPCRLTRSGRLLLLLHQLRMLLLTLQCRQLLLLLTGQSRLHGHVGHLCVLLLPGDRCVHRVLPLYNACWLPRGRGACRRHESGGHLGRLCLPRFGSRSGRSSSKWLGHLHGHLLLVPQLCRAEVGPGVYWLLHAWLIVGLRAWLMVQRKCSRSVLKQHARLLLLARLRIHVRSQESCRTRAEGSGIARKQWLAM